MINLQRIKCFLALPFLCLLLASCIYITDIGVYWQKGVIDKSLGGAWLSGDDGKDCMSFVVSGKNYLAIDNGKKDSSLYRTLLLDDNKFLMVKDPNNKYMLIKYTVSDDKFTTYMPDETKKEDFLRDYPDFGVVFSEGDFTTATIPVLNEKSIEMLQKIADDESYWKPASVQQRVKSRKTPDVKH